MTNNTNNKQTGLEIVAIGFGIGQMLAFYVIGFYSFIVQININFAQNILLIIVSYLMISLGVYGIYLLFRNAVAGSQQNE